MSQQESQKKKISPVVWVLIGILMVAAIATMYLIFYRISRVMSSPKPEITKLDGYGGFQNLNYVFYVDVTVKNNGGEGYITVYAELSSASKYEKQEQLVYLAKGQSQNLKFTFDVSLWNTLFSQVTYKAWATPK